MTKVFFIVTLIPVEIKIPRGDKMRKFLIPIALFFLVGFVNAQPILDFDNPQISETDIVQQLKDNEPNTKPSKLIPGSCGILKQGISKLTKSGEEIKVPPTVLSGKDYYSFKPNEIFYWWGSCSSQNENATWNVRIDYKFYPNYGGHNHNGNTPPLHYSGGQLDGVPVPNSHTYYDLRVNQTYRIYYKSPDFATRIHYDAHASGACYGDFYNIIDIKIDGLELLKPAWTDSLHGGATYYELIGQKPEHPINHFGKPQTITLLKEIAWRYHSEFPTADVLCINDISLRWGGLFDKDATWTPPHTFHRYGRQADLRLRTIPVGNRERFKQICCNLGVEVQLHSKNYRALNFSESLVWENIDFNSPPWNSLSEEELDMRVPHYHLVFPKFDDEIDDPPDQIPQGCPPSKNFR